MSEPRSTDEATVATVSGTTAAPTAVGAGLGSDGGVMVAATTGNKHDLAAVDGDNGNGEGEGDGEGNGTVVGDVSKDGGVHNEEHDQENEQENDQGQQASEIEGKPDSDEQQVPKDGEASESFDAELEAMKKRLHQMEQETSTMHGSGTGDDTMMPSTSSSGGLLTDQGDMIGTGGPNMDMDGSGHAMGGGVGSGGGGPGGMMDETTADSDARSIYVGNVDYNATGEELNQYFHECGTINRVTIMCHKHTGQPKGYAYIEFKERESVQNALILNDSLFRGRQLKVVEKRTNIPGVTRGGIGRARGSRYTRGGWRGGAIGGGFRGRPRGRGRGRGRWAPY